MWSHLVDMEMDDEDKFDATGPIPLPEKPTFPYGLKICLTEKELAKLDLSDDCSIGDYIDIRAFACVTSVSKTDTGTRVELQIERMSVENESTEDEAA